MFNTLVNISQKKLKQIAFTRNEADRTTILAEMCLKEKKKKNIN